MTQPAEARQHGTSPGRAAVVAPSSTGTVPAQPGAEGTGQVHEVLVLLEDARQRAQVAAALTGSRYVVAHPERLLDWVRSRRPHVLVVTDDGAPATRARQVVAEVAPEAAYVVLVRDATPEQYRTLLATCTAVLPAASSASDVVVAVAAAWRALTCLPVSAARLLAGGAPGAGDRPSLSARDIGWLRALADGTTVGSLARSAGYSQREMYRLLAALYARLGADTRTEALLRADRAGLLATDPSPPPARGADRPQGARP